jgi:translation initiation factor 6
MRLIQLDFYGDHNIGLFGRSSDKVCILGNVVSKDDVDKIEKTLNVEAVKSTVVRTDLVGMFCCINSNGIILPSIASEGEIGRLDSTGLDILALDSKFTALGNLVLCNDNGAIIGNPLEKYKKKIERCLGVDAECTTVAGMNTVGSCSVATNEGCVLHRDANEEEIQIIEKTLGVEVGLGTANFGSPFIGSCAIANSSGAAVGESTTGPEINRIMESLKLF